MRRRTGLCLLEGVRLVEAALGAGARLKDVFVVPGLAEQERAQALVKALAERGIPVTAVTTRVMEGLSAAETPPGIIAVAEKQETDAEGFLGSTAVLIADGIADPGNMGTMARTAAAAGAALWTRLGSVDLYDPKALRASAGALFLVPHRQRWSTDDLIAQAGSLGLALVVADARGTVSYDEFDWRGPFALAVGSEAHGVSSSLREAAACLVSIPMKAGVESLNAAAVAAVCLFEAVRQRNRGRL
ncbi:MAG: RNA methyltransferase [Firmicutes bacterium]|nr:RNA methyltransferase [Bacillota bacterium]